MSIEERLKKTEARLDRVEGAISGMLHGAMEHDGHITALEQAHVLMVLNFAATQPQPFEWVQRYVESQRQAIKTLVIERDGPAGERVRQEVRRAMEETLENIILRAGQLPGAPTKQ